MAALENLTTRLEGSIVTLEPMRPEHAEELWAAAQAPEIWAWLANLNERERFDHWLELSFEAAAAGREGPFATRDAESGAIIGSSRFLKVRPADRVVEIGWTWLNPRAWRSGANVEAKLLMMGHAFETLGCVRVEFKTDARNERSRNALAALPARFEGILRNHMIVPDVGQRDSAYFSVIPSEWPAVRRNLERRLGRGAGEKCSDTTREASGPAGLSLRRSNDPAELDQLEPLWNALQHHHVEVTPDLGPRTRERTDQEAWRIRRAKYERWLADPDSFFVVAALDGEPAGYAFVTVGMPYASWDAGERLADLETLSVLPEHRSAGVGAALLDAVWERLAELDVTDMQIVTTSTNIGAKRFYERHGFSHRLDVYYGKSPLAGRDER
ncbi:MAG TPA: GNAT family N-acetyltransferase, partial [Solirubrobacterales bacterium]|nr:GNAT family N-acetyltransferase [Solirubrobacterales bacterium]